LAGLFVCPGDRQPLAGGSLPSYAPHAAALVVQRPPEFLDRVS